MLAQFPLTVSTAITVTGFQLLETILCLLSQCFCWHCYRRDHEVFDTNLAVVTLNFVVNAATMVVTTTTESWLVKIQQFKVDWTPFCGSSPSPGWAAGKSTGLALLPICQRSWVPGCMQTGPPLAQTPCWLQDTPLSETPAYMADLYDNNGHSKAASVILSVCACVYFLCRFQAQLQSWSNAAYFTVNHVWYSSTEHCVWDNTEMQR